MLQFFIDFCISSPDESEGTIGLGSAKIAIISPVYFKIKSSGLVLVIGTTVRINLTVSEIRVLLVDGM